MRRGERGRAAGYGNWSQARLSKIFWKFRRLFNVLKFPLRNVRVADFGGGKIYE